MPLKKDFTISCFDTEMKNDHAHGGTLMEGCKQDRMFYINMFYRGREAACYSLTVENWLKPNSVGEVGER